MSDNYVNPIKHPDPHSEDILQRIAEALGIPAAALLSGPRPDAEIDGTVEMLRIWRSLVHAADRQEVLAFMRAVAAARL